MSQIDNANYEVVLNIVRQWPSLQQMELVQDVLKGLTVRLEPAGHPGDTLSRALGLLATDHSAPTDEEIEKWLDEHRCATLPGLDAIVTRNED